MKQLKKRWGVTSNVQLTIIFIVFAITGSASTLLTKPLLSVFGVTYSNTPLFWFILLKILLLFPVYQVLLVVIGSIFGQHTFFWNFEKKMLQRLKLGTIAIWIENMFGWNPKV
ncbi:MAG: DUF6787 family protein [Flavobacterium sp.]